MVNQVISTPHIKVGFDKGDQLNGLATMMIQYLQQNLDEFEHKRKQASGIQATVCVEVQNGVSITISFEKALIRVKNGSTDKADLYLSGSFARMAGILAGKLNPLTELIKNNINVRPLLRRPIRSYKIIRFLRMPSEFKIQADRPSRRIF